MPGEHRAQRRQVPQAVIELRTLVTYPARHLTDHHLVLAAQPVQLEGLLDLVAAAHRQQVQRHRRGFLKLSPHLLADDHLLLRNHLFRQRVLQLLQPAAPQQCLITMDLGHQTLLRRHRIDPRRGQVQEIAHRHHLARNLQVVLGIGPQFVPQSVNLVQHHKAPGAVRLADVGLPHLDIGARHPGIGGQHEQHRMGVRNHVQRQLRLGADGVQARGIDDHQPQLQERVRNVDDGMPPGGNLHLPRRHRPAHRLLVVIQAHLAGLLGRHQQRLAHRVEGLAQRLHIRHVHRNEAPVLVLIAQLGQRHRHQPRINGEQPDTHRHRGVVQQLGRTHRGAPGRRRNHPLAILCEEDRVDQLRLAAGELGHECHLQQGVVQPFDDLRKLDVQAGIGRIGLRQPVTVALDRRLEIGPPPAIRFDLLADAFLCHVGSVHKPVAHAIRFPLPSQQPGSATRSVVDTVDRRSRSCPAAATVRWESSNKNKEGSHDPEPDAATVSNRLPRTVYKILQSTTTCRKSFRWHLTDKPRPPPPRQRPAPHTPSASLEPPFCTPSGNPNIARPEGPSVPPPPAIVRPSSQLLTKRPARSTMPR